MIITTQKELLGEKQHIPSSLDVISGRLPISSAVPLDPV
jgi:hypothetical protein